MSNITRDDARYVSSTDPRAVLVAFQDPNTGHMDLGGWTDSNVTDFRAAAEDELTHGAGGSPVDLSVIVITEKAA